MTISTLRIRRDNLSWLGQGPREVTAFVAPALAVDGSITVDGTTEVIDASAFGAIDAATITTLTLLADAHATTCLQITADTDGAIVDLNVAASARICGTASLDSTTGLHSVAGVDLPMSLIAAGSSLDALLDAAATANANVCADVTIDATTGLITAVGLDATLTVCGDAALDADSATLAGVDVPFTLLDAEAEAALQLAANADANVCLTVVVDDTSLVQANQSASVDLPPGPAAHSCREERGGLSPGGSEAQRSCGTVTNRGRETDA